MMLETTDVVAATSSGEPNLVGLASDDPATRLFLHVGCGRARADRLPSCFREGGWREIRLDIDPEVGPDIVASITDMAKVPDASFDAVWSSHNLEHLHSFEVPLALNEFFRVLKPDGFVLINLPDLRAIARYILADNLSNPMYQSEVGVITPLDVLFGHQQSLQKGHHFMAHRTGFTATTLGQCLLDAGFAEVRVTEGRSWDLWALALMPASSRGLLTDMAGVMR
jgi:predicted SAM-dependent methyltransferase